MRDRIRGRRVLCLLTYDATAWLLGILTFAVLRVDMDLAALSWPTLAAIVVVCWLLQTSLGWVLRLYHGRARLASLEEMFLLGWVVTTAGGLTFLLNAVAHPAGLPRSVPLGGMLLALALMGWGRALWRRSKELSGRVSNSAAKPALVFGAGNAGHQLVRSMLRANSSEWRPVGLLDDDRWKQHLRIEGIPVLGTRNELAEAANSTGAQALIIAIPSGNAQMVRALSYLAHRTGLIVKILPALTELMDQHVDSADIRDIDLADVLGRRQIETDLELIAGYIAGKTVLVTGAGGSIGSELCRQIFKWKPSKLILLDRDESALHAVQLSIHGRAMLDTDDVALADIRDAVTIAKLFQRQRPQVIFHTAALKHLPMLEQYPGEAVKTNIWGTLTVLEAALACGAEKFINISTDKAANPANVLGYSKRITERLTSFAAAQSDGTFVSVRFGNVLGSRGSVLKTFAAQIAHGGPVTVTHPEVTRFFMTVQEAVQLVIQAGAIGSDGETLVLDMGQPVRIDSLAKQLIEQAEASIDVQYTGLRAGEKLHEQLFDAEEIAAPTAHPSILQVRIPALAPDNVRALDPWATRTEVRKSLAMWCAQEVPAGGTP